jgi:hypothetical protein
MSISLGSARVRTGAGAALVAAVAAVTGAAGAASASAAVVHPDTTRYSCTASDPEICLGITGSGNAAMEFTVQVHTDFSDYFKLVVSGPGVDDAFSVLTGGDTWSVADGGSIGPDSGGTYCASIDGGYTTPPDACVVWP